MLAGRHALGEPFGDGSPRCKVLPVMAPNQETQLLAAPAPGMRYAPQLTAQVVLLQGEGHSSPGRQGNPVRH
jgi:hypothetical protein